MTENSSNNRSESPVHPLVAADDNGGAPARQTLADEHSVEIAKRDDSLEHRQHPKQSLLQPVRGVASRGDSYASWDEGSSPDMLEDSAEDDEQAFLDEVEREVSDGYGQHRSGNTYKNGMRYERVHSSDDNEHDVDENELVAEDAQLLARKRRRVRKVYGGGRRFAREAEGDRGILHTAWSLYTLSVAPGTPCLIPYAFSLTGLSFGIPLLIILLVLGHAFSHVILTGEARYVGARSYPSLASAVFPQVWGIKYLGEILVELFSVFVSGGRALIGLYISSQLLIDLFWAMFPRANILHSKVFVSLLLGLAFLIPSLLHGLSSRRPAFLSGRFVSQLPQLSVLLYPLVLLIVGVSLKNLSDYPSLIKPNPHLGGRPNWDREKLHEPSLWSGVSVLFLICAGNQQYTFSHYRQLQRTLPQAEVSDDGSSQTTKPSTLEKMVQRQKWECSVSLAAALTGVTLVGFGLVGYVSLLVVRPNVFENLPRDHTWFNIARVLTLVTILALLTNVMEPARIAAAGALALPRRLYKPSKFQSRHTRSRSNSVLDLDDEDEEEENERRAYSHSRLWENRIANFLVWGGAIALACTVRDLGAVAEILGTVGSTWFGFIIPAAFFIVLFHVRTPRTIFITEASAPSVQTDQLLLRKERQLQKRLMGKRLWMDLGTFAILLPVGIVGFARGVWALASG